MMNEDFVKPLCTVINRALLRETKYMAKVEIDKWGEWICVYTKHPRRGKKAKNNQISIMDVFVEDGFITAYCEEKNKLKDRNKYKLEYGHLFGPECDWERVIQEHILDALRDCGYV